MALLMPLFVSIRNWSVWDQYDPPPVIRAGISGAISKIVAASWLYPVDVVRTNIRFVERNNVPVQLIVRQLAVSKPRYRAFFGGLGWYWLNSAGGFGIIMALESVRQSI